MIGAVELIGLVMSLGLLAGWRLYAVVLAVGVAMRTGWLDLPQRIEALDALGSWWVIGLAGIGFAAEFFVDKLAWVDSLWDAVHTLVRPAGGALVALAVVDPSNPVWQVVTLLAGGSAALIGHGAKAGARAVVNTSPEPFSNVAISAAEDVLSVGSLWLALSTPWGAVAVGAILLVVSIAFFVLSRRILRRIRAWSRVQADGTSGVNHR